MEKVHKFTTQIYHMSSIAQLCFWSVVFACRAGPLPIEIRWATDSPSHGLMNHSLEEKKLEFAEFNAGYKAVNKYVVTPTNWGSHELTAYIEFMEPDAAIPALWWGTLRTSEKFLASVAN